MNKPLLDTLQGKQPEVPPVWVMRQAGRFMPEYREIRKQNSFLDMCKKPELATEVTLLPVELFDMDGAILFSDILIPCEPMGMDLEFIEGRGPVFHSPIRTREDVESLRTEGVAEEAGFVYEALNRVRRYLSDNKTLIGFAGAPFTLACYMVEGGASRNYTYLKAMMYNDERSFCLLMEKLSTVLEDYLFSQIKAGAEVIQLFDTYGGVLSPFDYERYVFPYVKRIFSTLKGQFPETPLIYFAKNGFSFFPLLQELKADCLGVDWSVSLTDAAARSGNRFVLQGNLDPVVLFGGSDVIEREARRVISEGRKIKGHVFNLGHGILPETPVDSVRTLIEVIRCSQASF